MVVYLQHGAAYDQVSPPPDGLSAPPPLEFLKYFP